MGENGQTPATRYVTLGMSMEQAVEEVLKGPWEKCPSCKGGYELSIHDQMEVCGVCRGYGTLYRQPYLDACMTLGLTVAQRSTPISEVALKEALEEIATARLSPDMSINAPWNTNKP